MENPVFHYVESEPAITQCTVCKEFKRQANVCRSCRGTFIPLVPLGTGAVPLDCSCSNCDFYGFPCLNCAEFSLMGLLGDGYGCVDDESDSDDESEEMDVDWCASWRSCGEAKKVDDEAKKGKEKVEDEGFLFGVLSPFRDMNLKEKDE